MCSTRGLSGVLQYDHGKLIQDRGFIINGILNQPPEILLSGLGKVRGAPLGSGMFQQYLSWYDPRDYRDILSDRYMYDRLFPKDCIHLEAEEESWSYKRKEPSEGKEDEEDADDPCKRSVYPGWTCHPISFWLAWRVTARARDAGDSAEAKSRSRRGFFFGS